LNSESSFDVVLHDSTGTSPDFTAHLNFFKDSTYPVATYCLASFLAASLVGLGVTLFFYFKKKKNA